MSTQNFIHDGFEVKVARMLASKHSRTCISPPLHCICMRLLFVRSTMSWWNSDTAGL